MLLCSQCDVSDERSNFDRKIEAMFRVYSSKNGSLSMKNKKQMPDLLTYRVLCQLKGQRKSRRSLEPSNMAIRTKPLQHQKTISSSSSIRINVRLRTRRSW
jgi:hypothetical protein